MLQIPESKIVRVLDGDQEAATAALQEALTITRRYGFNYLEVQCCTLLGGVAGMTGDHRTPRRATSPPRPCATTWLAGTRPNRSRPLAAGRSAHRRRPAPLSDKEVVMIKFLPSPSVEQIAAELGITGSEEARGMMRTVYRKLGASSRRTAVAADFERRLLR